MLHDTNHRGDARQHHDLVPHNAFIHRDVDDHAEEKELVAPRTDINHNGGCNRIESLRKSCGDEEWQP